MGPWRGFAMARKRIDGDEADDFGDNDLVSIVKGEGVLS